MFLVFITNFIYIKLHEGQLLFRKKKALGLSHSILFLDNEKLQYSLIFSEIKVAPQCLTMHCQSCNDASARPRHEQLTI